MDSKNIVGLSGTNPTDTNGYNCHEIGTQTNNCTQMAKMSHNNFHFNQILLSPRSKGIIKKPKYSQVFIHKNGKEHGSLVPSSFIVDPCTKSFNFSSHE